MSPCFKETSEFAGWRHCNQAEAKDAAPAHIAAQSASEDSKTTTHRASLVSATATSHPRRSACNKSRGGLSLLTEQWRCGYGFALHPLLLDRQTGIASWWPVRGTALRPPDGVHFNHGWSVRRLLHVKKWSASLFESDLTQFWLNRQLIVIINANL